MSTRGIITIIVVSLILLSLTATHFYKVGSDTGNQHKEIIALKEKTETLKTGLDSEAKKVAALQEELALANKNIELNRQAAVMGIKFLNDEVSRNPLGRLSEVYERAEYVVHLHVAVTRQFNIPGIGTVIVPKQKGILSGSIISFRSDEEDHYLILTAGHIQDASEKLTDVLVHFKPSLNMPVEEAEMLAYDHTKDLCVLQFKNPKFKFKGRIPKIGFSENLPLCSWVMAIGSPLGTPFTPSVGILVNTDTGVLQGYNQPQILTHHAKINPGNSGGPLILLNDKDEIIIGVNVMTNLVNAAESHIYFAVPSRDVRTFLKHVISERQFGEISHVTLHMKFVDTSILDRLDYEEDLRIAPPKVQGIMVTSVIANSPADQAGLKVGDLILSLNGVEFADAVSLTRYILDDCYPGRIAKLKVRRADAELNFELPFSVYEPD